jgi:hypothetical protein
MSGFFDFTLAAILSACGRGEQHTDCRQTSDA